MKDFSLIDLDSQALAFSRYVRGWTIEKITELMKEYGEVLLIPYPHDDKIYNIFRSQIGIKTAFRFSEEGRVVIFGDNSTYLPDAEDSHEE